MAAEAGWEEIKKPAMVAVIISTTKAAKYRVLLSQWAQKAEQYSTLGAGMCWFLLFLELVTVVCVTDQVRQTARGYF